MKSIPTFLLLFAAICCFTGCYESKPAPKYPIDGAVDLSQPAPAATTPAGAEPAQNSAGVWHYTCSNGCAGGAGAAGNCAVCGNALAHNSAYHNNAGTPTTPVTPTTPTTETTSTNVNFSSDEPAQNAAGVWHYTCSNGCSGGAGAAGNCASCGGALAHNSAYH